MTAQDRDFIIKTKKQIQVINTELLDIYERESRSLSSLLPEEENSDIAIRFEERLITLDTLSDLLIDVSVGLCILLEEEKDES